MCDGITRREVMQVGGLSLFGGMTLPRLLQAQSREQGRAAPPRAAKSVILINLIGGPSHIDMFDMKPDAPAEIRGEFRPIQTSLTGLRICEHMPRIALEMHRACLIQTMSHNYNAHNPLSVMTGFAGGDITVFRAKPSDPPSMGAVCQYLGRGPKGVPTHAVLPSAPGVGEGARRPGPWGGFLGARYDPLVSRCDPTFNGPITGRLEYIPNIPFGVPGFEGLDLAADVTLTRLNDRSQFLNQLDAHFDQAHRSPTVAAFDDHQKEALDVLTTGGVRDAFNLEHEPAAIRDNYGRNLYGQSTLVARRLVEAGVTFVTVSWLFFNNDDAQSWDTHRNVFGILKNTNLPILDRAYPALIQDLEARGLLDSTLVVVMGEMGREPKLYPLGGNASGAVGRGHWPQCGFSLLTGGGVKPGMVYGASDRIGAYPQDHPVSPANLVATIYHLLGIDPDTTVPDRAGRPHPIAHGGEPIIGIVA